MTKTTNEKKTNVVAKKTKVVAKVVAKNTNVVTKDTKVEKPWYEDSSAYNFFLKQELILKKTPPSANWMKLSDAEKHRLTYY